MNVTLIKNNSLSEGDQNWISWNHANVSSNLSKCYRTKIYYSKMNGRIPPKGWNRNGNFTNGYKQQFFFHSVDGFRGKVTSFTDVRKEFWFEFIGASDVIGEFAGKFRSVREFEYSISNWLQFQNKVSIEWENEMEINVFWYHQFKKKRVQIVFFASIAKFAHFFFRGTTIKAYISLFFI